MPHVSHPRLDLPFFERIFTLDSLGAKATEHASLMPSGQIVTSPVHLTVVELLRRQVVSDPSSAPGAKQVDVFVLASGEPRAPYLTKFGGVPFRSRHKPWPRTGAGRALGFVGQVSFVDSRDLVEDLPGDVLLVFADAEAPLSPSEYLLEWVRLDEANPMSKMDMPNVTFTVRPGRMAMKRGAQPEVRAFEPFVCHGVIHRTVDLAGMDDLFRAYPYGKRLSVIEGTKIGGIPHAIQTGLDVTGRFLASVASIQPAAEVSYPWVNDATTLSLTARRGMSTWKLGDMGSLYVFDAGGLPRLELQSY